MLLGFLTSVIIARQERMLDIYSSKMTRNLKSEKICVFCGNYEEEAEDEKNNKNSHGSVG